MAALMYIGNNLLRERFFVSRQTWRVIVKVYAAKTLMPRCNEIASSKTALSDSNNINPAGCADATMHCGIKKTPPPSLTVWRYAASDYVRFKQVRMYYELAVAAAYAPDRRCVCSHQKKTIFCVKWRHGRCLESLTLFTKGKKVKAHNYSSSWEPYLAATGSHLPYGITQWQYLPPDTSERAPSNPSHAGWYSTYVLRRDGRLSWPSWLGSVVWNRIGMKFCRIVLRVNAKEWWSRISDVTS